MSANLISNDEVHQIIGCPMTTLNRIGHELSRKNYENALAVESSHCGISFEQQKRFPLLWREAQVGDFIPNLISLGGIIIDTKNIDRVTDHETRPNDQLSPHHRPLA